MLNANVVRLFERPGAMTDLKPMTLLRHVWFITWLFCGMQNCAKVHNVLVGYVYIRAKVSGFVRNPKRFGIGFVLLFSRKIWIRCLKKHSRYATNSERYDSGFQKGNFETFLFVSTGHPMYTDYLRSPAMLLVHVWPCDQGASYSTHP